MRRLNALIASFVLLGTAALSPAQAAPACPVLKPHYVLKADPAFTAGFAKSARSLFELASCDGPA